ncbi:MAG: hypothetical protein JXK07_15990 [Spirochaetes bacterium]|nr:hypothetical protein [Spirochaetota bacterium]MBN2772018.1 hypothetical protein [Spirochaetota bacterium]
MNKFIKLVIVCSLITSQLTGCSTYLSLSFIENNIHGEKNTVTYYTGFAGKPDYQKVLLYIEGSGRHHASKKFGMGAEASLYGYSIVYPQKKDIHNKDTYFTSNNRDQRLHDLRTVIKDLKSKGAVEILILSESEGTMLAPALSFEFQDIVSGLICISGSLNTFEADLISSIKNKTGRYKEWQLSSVEQLNNEISQIFTEPDNISKNFLGHSYKFWSSYLRYDPLYDVKQLHIPILYINGDHDEIDFNNHKKKIESLKTRGINIEQILYKGQGHRMDGMGKKIAHDILHWANENQVIR